MTGDDLKWVGDEMEFQEKWPMKSNVLRIAQLNTISRRIFLKFPFGLGKSANNIRKPLRREQYRQH